MRRPYLGAALAALAAAAAAALSYFAAPPPPPLPRTADAAVKTFCGPVPCCDGKPGRSPAPLGLPTGDTLRIVGPAAVPLYRLAELRAEGASEGAVYLWDVSPDDQADTRELPGGRLVFVAPKGTYKIRVHAIDLIDGKPRVSTARTTVVVGDNPPQPPNPGRADPVNATCRLRVGNSGCTATIVSPRRADGRWDVLTAAHCTGAPGTKGSITLKDGRTLSVIVTVRDTSADLTWLVTERADMPDLPFADLAESDPAPGTPVWHNGYGVDRPGNREDGNVIDGPNDEGQLRFSLSVSSGDSGGGIFRADDGRLVGAVCCTQGLARRATMWAGAASVARRLRPPTAGP